LNINDGTGFCTKA
jgi:hypothetical protein